MEAPIYFWNNTDYKNTVVFQTEYEFKQFLSWYLKTQTKKNYQQQITDNDNMQYTAIENENGDILIF